MILNDVTLLGSPAKNPKGLILANNFKLPYYDPSSNLNENIANRF
jgi:hypothetical protein